MKKGKLDRSKLLVGLIPAGLNVTLGFYPKTKGFTSKPCSGAVSRGTVVTSLVSI